MRRSRERAPLSARGKWASKDTPGFLRMLSRKRRAFSLRTCTTSPPRSVACIHRQMLAQACSAVPVGTALGWALGIARTDKGSWET